METLQYHTIEDLWALPLNELHALWELVPTDRQRAYKAAYEREVRTAGAVGSDELEKQVAAELLKRYEQAALVPVGSRWARTPGRVQEAAKQNTLLEAPEDEAKLTARRLSPKVLAAGGIAACLFLGLMLSRLFSGHVLDKADVTPTITITPTPVVSPTPTPLALEAQDEVIRGGDSGREVAYPVNLQVILPNGDTPRVWVVQRRRVQASEWRFDPNPDTASFVNGMSVRPIIGIPWSEDNAAFFAGIGEGASFLVTMNTGAVLRFTFEERHAVRRSQTSIFRQVSPGLVLLLIGETDEAGLPTGTRTVITATYPPEQELLRDGQVMGLETTVQDGHVGETLTLGDASITLRNAQVISDAGSESADRRLLALDFDVTVGEEEIDTSTWCMEFVDAAGQMYPLSSEGLMSTTFDALPFSVPALSSLSASAAYLISSPLQQGQWRVTDLEGNSAVFTVFFESPSLDMSYDRVDVRLVSVMHTAGQLTTHLRIYNGRAEPLHITQDDIWLALGYAPEPPGPRNPAEGLEPFDLLPEQAVDLMLVWYWNGEPYAIMGLGEYRFGIQVGRHQIDT